MIEGGEKSLKTLQYWCGRLTVKNWPFERVFPYMLFFQEKRSRLS